MWLYANFEGNGTFLVDNISYEIQNNDGNWIPLEIKNSDFENNTDNPLKNFLSSPKQPEGITVNTANRTDLVKGKALQIKATRAFATWKTYYGNNKTNGKFCEANGIKLYYETYGSGEPLLLLHGNGQSIAAFNQQIPDFARKYKVIAVDTRAQGKSYDKDTGKLSYDRFTDDMKVLLDSLKLGKVNILGWSDGGNTALILAIKYPQYVKKLMVMGANLNPTEQAVESKVLNQVKKDLKTLQQKNDIESKQMVRLLSMLLTEPSISTEDLHKISSKTLVMAGEKDVIKPEHTHLIADNIKNSKLVIFKKESHMVPEENAALFNKAVLDFLDDK